MNEINNVTIEVLYKLVDTNSELAKKLEEYKDKVRLVTIPDIHSTFEDLSGDMFSLEANPESDYYELAQEEVAFKNRIKNEGVWIFQSEVRKPDGNWEVFDAIGGFVGNDFVGSGYDADLVKAVIEESDRLQNLTELTYDMYVNLKVIKDILESDDNLLSKVERTLFLSKKLLNKAQELKLNSL